MRKLSVGSLFSGIGGIDLGLERAGMRILWQCEIDKYARRVLSRHWPGIPCYSDVRELCTDKGEWPEPVDLLCGGFPCQDISTAGCRAGIGGERSGLFFEIIRIVRVLRPRYILLENVAALTIRGLDVVLGELALCGYDAEWDCISAASVGAIHRRDRLFILAYSNNDRCDSACNNERGPERKTWNSTISFSEQWKDSEKRLVDATNSKSNLWSSFRNEGQEAFNRSHPERSNYWAVEPNVGRVAHGVPSRVDRLKCLGNAVVPQVAEYVGRCIVDYDAII